MGKQSKENDIAFLVTVGVVGWLVPGGGYFLLNEQRRALIIFATICVTFFAGLYVGSIGVVDPVGARLWYLVQMMATPAVFLLGEYTKSGAYTVYGKPGDVGQIYTSIAGLLNLLVIVNSVYVAHLRQRREERYEMADCAFIIIASLRSPLHIGTNPASMLWLLPLTAAVCIVYKATKLKEIKAAAFIREVGVLFGSVIVFMAIVAAVLFAFAWLFTS